ncbi:uncharacterized protein LOC109816422 [Cajanus cajan]|uniref:Uncharacterized protein n=1 Tax=Cajanus cajan TaxID=3821 RepID=A0A151RRL3_CAJCA|nr:uncharacterized protein LOC109816422 [Cajanus cajan]KYP45158.1 hypothetical protein KK1_033291 [Cajanus cajan]
MDRIRAYSSPHFLSSSTSNFNGQPEEECGLEGLATNVKLLLKLIQDHNGSSPKENDERKYHRVNGMMLILDEARSRVQKIQSSTMRKAELRRCNTDLRPNLPTPKDKRPPDAPMDEKERLKRELNASLVARQSLQALCSSLGKEKQIMAAELARKAQELTEMEDFIGDLKAQNDMLMEKLHECSSEQKEKKSNTNGVEMECNIVLRERNKALSEQLQKSLDGYRSMKRKLRDVLEENRQIRDTMEQMEEELQAGIHRISSFKEGKRSSKLGNDIKEGISALEHMLHSLMMKISKHTQKRT